MSRLFVTGDKHGNFLMLDAFCLRLKTTKDDVLVVLGDAGVNYEGEWDYYLKQRLAELPITFLFIHGNHEMRPQTIPTYIGDYRSVLPSRELTGFFYREESFPSLLFARSGEYWFQDYRFLVCDGAYSPDKDYRIRHGFKWWDDEQMSNWQMEMIETLVQINPSFDFVFSHAAPLSQEPRHLFISQIDQNKIDLRTPQFLDKIYSIIDREKLKQWYFGHYHADEKLPCKFTILFNDFIQVV